jgi:RNA polymerase sporulation-specific sigma factor
MSAVHSYFYKSNSTVEKRREMVIKVAVADRFRFKMVPSIKNLYMLGSKEVHYIGGAEVLPAPLDTDEEKNVLAMLKTEDDDYAKKMLIEHNLRLVVYIAKKFDNTGVGVEDLISIGTIGLIKAINSYDRDKNIKLATYASRCIENEILMHLRRNSKIRAEVSIDEPLNVDWDGNELLLSDILGTDDDVCYKDLENEVEMKALKSALGNLSERERIIVDLRYGLSDKDGEERMILGHKVTFFDILSTKAKQFGFCMEYADGKKLTCCGDEPYNECEHKYAEGVLKKLTSDI